MLPRHEQPSRAECSTPPTLSRRFCANQLPAVWAYYPSDDLIQRAAWGVGVR